MKDKIEKILLENKIQFEFIPLPEELASDVKVHMKFHGNSMDRAMPNIVFKTNKGFIVAQRRGDTKIDSKKLKKLAGVSDLRVATEEELKDLNLAPGIVPPTGIDATYFMDNKIFEKDFVYSGTGDKLFAIKLNPIDLKEINKSTVGDFTTQEDFQVSNKIVFSGIQPSGNLHIGNYIGSLRQWVKGQDNGLNIFCIVDMHAITVAQDPKILREKTFELAAIYLAAGIDPEKSLIFVQSHNPDHANLGWVLNCFASMGQMQRMTQYKDKSEGKDFVSVGLFDYPVLMAGDILFYYTTQVPLGGEKKNHLEFARDLRGKLNRNFRDIVMIP